MGQPRLAILKDQIGGYGLSKLESKILNFDCAQVANQTGSQLGPHWATNWAPGGLPDWAPLPYFRVTTYIIGKSSN